MKYQKLCDLVFEKLKNRMESSAGLAVCARDRPGRVFTPSEIDVLLLTGFTGSKPVPRAELTLTQISLK